MFQVLIQNIINSLRGKAESSHRFPMTRPEDTVKKEPVLDSISKQTSQPESVNNQITDSVTVTEVVTPVVEEPPKKKRTTKQNGSKTTKRKSK